MNLKEQQYVCTLARCQTISKAAEELYISPSALSVYISNLEKYLGHFSFSPDRPLLCADADWRGICVQSQKNAGNEG